MLMWLFPAHWCPTEELRALTWSRVNLDGNPPTIDLWRSVRAHGDTKTRKSRRTARPTSQKASSTTTKGGLTMGLIVGFRGLEP
jgi:hypothetical protein